MANIVPMRFAKIPTTACWVCVSHKANQDGYLRKRWGTPPNSEIEMFHRFIYRAHHGLDVIPEGYEIHHTCHNRGCCNPDHLELIARDEHLDESNRSRYAFRIKAAKQYWKEHPEITGTALSEKFGVSFGLGCRWIRSWNHGTP